MGALKIYCMVKSLSFFSSLLCHGRWVEGLWNGEVLIHLFFLGRCRFFRTFSWIFTKLAFKVENCSWYSKVRFYLFRWFLNFVCLFALDSPSIYLFQIVDYRGLEYLHEFCKPVVIHRDLKSSNILLDANFNAKVKMYNFF